MLQLLTHPPRPRFLTFVLVLGFVAATAVAGAAAMDDGQGPARIEGTWNWNGNNQLALLSISGGSAQLRWGDGTVEPLKNLRFDSATGQVSFYRDAGQQPYTGVVSGDEIRGTFTQYGRANQTFPWCAARSGACTLGGPRTPPPSGAVAPVPGPRPGGTTPPVGPAPPCTTRFVTVPPPGGSLATFEEGHIVPAGRYDVWVSPSEDQRTAAGPWQRFGPYDLRGGRKFLFMVNDISVSPAIETDARTNVYPVPSADTAATYYDNRSPSRTWKAITVCPVGPSTAPLPPAPPQPIVQPCANRYLTVPAPGGSLPTFEEGHIVSAGRYNVWTSPSADQRTASVPFRAFGPHDLQAGKKYLFFISDNAVSGPNEADSRLARYPAPGPGMVATYYDNRSESRRWMAATVCPVAAGPGPTPPVAPPPPSVRDGLVASWSADGNTVDGVTGNSGTIRGGVTYAPGATGQAFRIDGRPGTGIAVGNPAALRTQTFTIVAWIRRADAAKATLDSSYPTACLLCYGSGGYAFGVWDDGRLFLSRVLVSVVNSSALKVTDTAFHLVAVTAAQGRVTFYVDGKAEAVAPYNPGYTFSSDAAIGARGDLVNPWYGLIDEVQVYDRALPEAEIRAMARRQ